MSVYVDVLMLLNFAVDLCLLLGTNRLSGHPPNIGRAALAAAFGSVYAGACVLPGFSFLGNFLWRLVSWGIISVIAFGATQSGLRRGILFLLLSMALGGIALCLNQGGFWALVLAAAGVCFLCLVGFRGRVGQQYVSVDICYGGACVSLKALVDTGNGLRDPVTGCPVLVVEAASAKKLLTFAEGELEHPLETMLSHRYTNLRLIPYTAVGQPGGFLLAIRPDSVTINGKGVDHMVAFTPQNLGHGQYQALAGVIS